MAPEEEEFAERVLQAEEELFSYQEKCFNWQTIQFYRTIAMNIVTIIITSPLYRFMALVPVLCVFSIHDRTRKPFKDAYLNRIQTLSSRCLLLVLLCNLVASLSFTADISMVDGVALVAKMSSIIEMILYAVVPLYFPFLKIWEIVMTRRGKKND